MGHVSFEPAQRRRTVLVLTRAAYASGAPSRETLEQKLARDLVIFKDCLEHDIERGDNRVGPPTAAEKKAAVEDETRRAHDQPHWHIGADGEPVSYTDHLPT